MSKMFGSTLINFLYMSNLYSSCWHSPYSILTPKVMDMDMDMAHFLTHALDDATLLISCRAPTPSPPLRL